MNEIPPIQQPAATLKGTKGPKKRCPAACLDVALHQRVLVQYKAELFQTFCVAFLEGFLRDRSLEMVFLFFRDAECVAGVVIQHF